MICLRLLNIVIDRREVMIKKLILFFTIFICNIFTSRASHIVGGDFIYEYKGDTTIAGQIRQKYLVTLHIYQDCLNGVREAIEEDNPAFFTLYFNDTTITQYISYDTLVYYDPTPGSGGAITVPPNFSNDCVKNIPPVCLYRKRFQKMYYLPPNPKGYTVVYQRCCRNSSIINVIDPGDEGASYFCTIPANGVRNTSADFKNYPPQIICLNNPLFYDHSAFDADGDSLSYEFCRAEVGAVGNDIKPPVATPPPYDPVRYFPPFSFSTPMTGLPPIAIDPKTGLITGTPNRIGRYLVTICCHEWRNGVRINTVKREFQFVVTDCSKVVIADIPILSTQPNTYVVNCTDFTVKFQNKSTGGFSYAWDFGVEGSSSDISSEFEPTFVYPDTGTYSVKLIVNPGSSCPDSITRLVKIYPIFKTGIDDTGIHCPGVPINFIDKTFSTYQPVSNWTWSFGDGKTSTLQNPIHTYSTGGTYNVVFTAENIKNCVDTTLKKVVIQTFAPNVGNDTVIVKGEYIQFDARGGVDYYWMPATLLNDQNISNPRGGIYSDTGLYLYRVFVRTNYGCTGYDTIRVRVVNNAFFVLPTAFTPNGDGKNDIFRPIAAGYKTLKYFRVFNRWGEVVFMGNSIDDGWDGTHKGKKADMGTYFWEIQYVDRFGEEGLEKGDVTLVR